MFGVGFLDQLGFIDKLRGRGDGGAEEEPSVSVSKNEMLAAYIIREHKQGRTIEDILDDPYLRNRASGEERARLLERPDVIRSVGEDTAAAAQEYVRRGAG